MNQADYPKLNSIEAENARNDLMRVLGYLPHDEQQKVLQACVFGDIAHIHDKRKSGEPYITHPIAVAEILASFRMDSDTIIAAILHDTIEDTDVTDTQITQQFGKKVTQIVDGVTKLKSSNDKDKNKAATFYKIFTATLEEPRVLLVKLADRLHNMSTLDAVSEQKRISTAQETLDFYVPFARILGLNNIADYIEILCYRNLNPTMYNKLSDKLLQHGLGRAFHKESIQTYLNKLSYRLNVPSYIKDVDNRVELFRQFFKNRGEISNLLRQYTFMMVMDNVEDCDKVANYLIERYQIAPENIDDSIRKPRAGGNQSLTITYLRDLDTIKIIILTKTMLEATRLGVLMDDTASDVSRSVLQSSLRNLQELLTEDQSTNDDAMQTVEKLMSYLHERKIVCYTPNGDAHELPRGATALDFAYAVSTHIGNRATGAIINDKPAKLGSVLKNGQKVSIETDKHGEPRAEWLGFVATNKARRALLNWLKELNAEERQRHGKAAFARALQNHARNIDTLEQADWDNLLQWRGLQHISQLFEQISTGKLLPQLMVSRLCSKDQLIYNQTLAHQDNQPQSLIAEATGVEVDFSNCCHPIYGDEIVGHLSKNGLVIHRHKCFSVEDIRKDNPYQVIPLGWRQSDEHDRLTSRIEFKAGLKIYQPLNDEQISQMIFTIKELKAGFTSVTHLQNHTLVFLVIQSREHLSMITNKLRDVLHYPNIQRLYQWSE